VSLGQEEYSIEGRLVIRGEVSSTEGFQILTRSDTNDGHASSFGTHSGSFQEVAIIWTVRQGNGY